MAEIKQRISTVVLVLQILKPDEIKSQELDLTGIGIIDEELRKSLNKCDTYLDHDLCLKWLTGKDLYFLFIGLMVVSAWTESRCKNPHRKHLIAYINETLVAMIPICEKTESTFVMKMLLNSQDNEKAKLMLDRL